MKVRLTASPQGKKRVGKIVSETATCAAVILFLGKEAALVEIARGKILDIRVTPTMIQAGRFQSQALSR